MERYKILKPVGDGTFGSVSKAVNRSTGEYVAIKKMKQKFFSWEECLALREIKSLRKLTHQNIVKLKEVIRVNDELHLIFEFLEQNLYQLMKSRTQSFPESQVRALLYQTFQGLAFLHKHGFFHRDLKPENLMVNGSVCKVADFGLAREIRSKPPFTDYVSTRWYRAPEILLRSTNYNSPVDLFAMGCIMVELYNLKPLAPGSNENDQMFKLCSILGSPVMESWPEGFRLAAGIGYHFPTLPAQSLTVLVPGSCYEGIQLLGELLHWNPQKRITATQCLGHGYFTNYQPIMPNPQFEHGLPDERAVSKWSDGSSRISDQSAKGRLKVRPSAILPAQYGKRDSLPKVTEVPSQSDLGKRMSGIYQSSKFEDYGEELTGQGQSGRQSGKGLPSITGGGTFLKPANYKPAFPSSDKTIGLQNRAVPTYLGYPQLGVGGFSQMAAPGKLPPVQGLSHASNGAAHAGDGRSFPVRSQNKLPANLFPSLSRPKF